MSMPAVSKHLKVLERAGLITRGREAQWRPCRIEAQALKPVDEWLENYRRLWEERFDRLEVYLRELQAQGRARSRCPQEKQGEEACPQEIASSPRDRSLTLERVFDAPVDLVWRCWTEQEHLAKWSAPRGYTIPEARATFAPAASGAAACAIRRAAIIWLGGVYREIVPHKLHRDDACVGRRERQARHRDDRDRALRGSRPAHQGHARADRLRLRRVARRTSRRLERMPRHPRRASRRDAERADNDDRRSGVHLQPHLRCAARARVARLDATRRRWRNGGGRRARRCAC